MEKQNYENTINLQVKDLFSLVDVQTEKCFDRTKMDSMMSGEDFAKLKRVIISGCGDSYSAAGVVAPIMKELAGLESTESPDPMLYSTFYDQDDTLLDCDPDEVLVIAISASGNSGRILDILNVANDHGARTMLISNNPESKGSALADMLFYVETPAGLNSPGLRSYFASMIALLSLTTRIAVAKGIKSEKQEKQLLETFISYVKSYQAEYESIDDQMFELAQAWKDYTRFEIIGDDADYYSAQFVEEKVIECAGLQCGHYDSEDWCHINFFLKNPESIGTVHLVNSYSPSYDRALETVRVSQEIGRPTLAVVDSNTIIETEGVHVCSLPEVPAEYHWMQSFMNFIPGSILAAYLATVEGRFFFGGRYDPKNQVWL